MKWVNLDEDHPEELNKDKLGLFGNAYVHDYALSHLVVRVKSTKMVVPVHAFAYYEDKLVNVVAGSDYFNYSPAHLEWLDESNEAPKLFTEAEVLDLLTKQTDMVFASIQGFIMNLKSTYVYVTRDKGRS